MSKYAISIKEILKRTVIVEAESVEEALDKVESVVESGKIVLDFDDYDDREIESSNYWEDGKVPENVDVSYYWHLDEDT